MSVRHLRLKQIVTDPDVQPRERLSDAAIMEYGEAMLAGDEFPPVTVFCEHRQQGAQSGRRYWLADGFLRLEAAKAIGSEKIAAEIGAGGKRAAVLHSCGANARHGFRPTNRDKRRAVLKLLSDKEWRRWSDREISRAAMVSPGLVATMRDELGICSNTQIESADEKRRFRRGGEEHEMRLPQSKDRPRHQPERWALAQVYESIDALSDNVVSPGIEPAALLEHLTPEREKRLRIRLFDCLRWLHLLNEAMEKRVLEAEAAL